MKKSKTVRILCMALALLLVSQFAVTAFAATSSRWSDGVYWYYVVTSPRATATRYREHVTISGTSVYHGYGGSTDMTGYYDLAHCEEWFWSIPEYANDVCNTVAMDGYVDSYSENNVYMYDTIGGIPSSAPTRTYKIQTSVLNRPIPYTIYQEDDFGYAYAYIAGELLAPYDFSDEITGYSA